MCDDLHCEEICTISDCKWHLVFDGSPTHQGGEARIVLYAPNGFDVFLSFNLDFPSSTKEV